MPELGTSRLGLLAPFLAVRRRRLGRRARGIRGLLQPQYQLDQLVPAQPPRFVPLHLLTESVMLPCRKGVGNYEQGVVARPSPDGIHPRKTLARVRVAHWGEGASQAAREAVRPHVCHVSPLKTLRFMCFGPNAMAAYADRVENRDPVMVTTAASKTSLTGKSQSENNPIIPPSCFTSTLPIRFAVVISRFCHGTGKCAPRNANCEPHGVFQSFTSLSSICHSRKLL